MTSRLPGANCDACWPTSRGSRSSAKPAMSTTRPTRSRALSPELLLLDIHMPGGSGFDLLARLEYLPQVIFTTAHDEHAVRAFEVNALDYLLKPIDPRRLAAALAKVRRVSVAPGAGRRARADLRQGRAALLVRAAGRGASPDIRRQLRAAVVGHPEASARSRPGEPRTTPRSAALLPRQSSTDHQPGLHRRRGDRDRRTPARAVEGRPRSGDLASPGAIVQDCA